jgi:hypothetical protein
VAALLVRRVLVFVRAGLRAAPATGEDPAGLVLTFATLVGVALVLVGGGLLGVALRRLGGRPARAGTVLLAAPLVAVARLSGTLPLPVGRLLVRTNAVLLPFALGWAALGWAVATAS